MDENEILENQTEQTPDPEPVTETEPTEVDSPDESQDKEPSQMSDSEIAAALKHDPAKEAKEKALRETPKPPADLTPEQKQKANEQYMISRMGNEIGELRKIIAQLQQPKAPPPPPEEKLSPEEEFAKLAENPSEYVDKILERKVEQQREVQLNKAREVQAKVQEFETFAEKFMPDLKETAPTMVELMREDGFTQDQIVEMTANLHEYSISDWHHYYKRAIDRKEKAALKAENEKLKGKTTRVLNNVNNAVKNNQEKRISTSAVDTELDTNLTDEQIRGLSYEELNQYLKKGKR